MTMAIRTIPARTTITLTDEVEGQQHSSRCGRSAESEEDEASGLGQTSSEGSVYGDDKDERAPQAARKSRLRRLRATQAALLRSRQGAQAVGSHGIFTHLIARAIHRHALAEGNLDHENQFRRKNHPPPLTYKETVRLVRLIAMIFRFPKSSRRIVHDATAPLTPHPPLRPPQLPPRCKHILHLHQPRHSSSIELKPKYLAPHPSSSSRRPRILARVSPGRRPHRGSPAC